MGVMVGWGNSAITTRVKGRIDRSIGEVHLGSALLGSQPAHQGGDWEGDVVGETHGLWVRPVLLSGEMHQGGREPQASLVLQQGLPVVLETVSQPGGVDEVIHRLWEKREGKHRCQSQQRDLRSMGLGRGSTRDATYDEAHPPQGLLVHDVSVLGEVLVLFRPRPAGLAWPGSVRLTI